MWDDDKRKYEKVVVTFLTECSVPGDGWASDAGLEGAQASIGGRRRRTEKRNMTKGGRVWMLFFNTWSNWQRVIVVVVEPTRANAVLPRMTIDTALNHEG